MHAKEYIAKHLSTRRYLNLGEFRKQLERKAGECTWCGEATPTRRMRWCSKGCREQGYIAAGIRSKARVHKRDKGVCAICGIDTNAAGIPCEVDHILPVCEGGGCCGLDNLRTLCQACHKKETAKLAKRRSKSQVTNVDLTNETPARQ